ncbi:MAG: hypothetical protein ACR2HN_05680 [Tepidiformaceae bacterium]
MRDVPFGKLGAIAGLLFAVLLVVGLLLANGDSPSPDEPDAAHTEWWSDSGNQANALIGGYLTVLAGLAFLAFMTQVRARLLAREGGAGSLATAAFGSGVVFVALLTGGVLAMVTTAGAVKFGDAPVPGADILRILPQLGFGMILIGGGLTAAFSIAAVSWSILRTGVFARWLAWLGFVCAILLLFGVFFIPMIALPIWALAASVELWRRPEPMPMMA